MNSPGQYRDEFNFIEIVLSKFSCLFEYGFSCVEKKSTFVRFKSISYFIDIYHGRSSYELGLRVGRIQEDTSYGIGNFIDYRDPEKGKNYKAYSAVTPESLIKGLDELSVFFKEYCLPSLLEDSDIFKQLEHQCEQ